MDCKNSPHAEHPNINLLEVFGSVDCKNSPHAELLGGRRPLLYPGSVDCKNSPHAEHTSFLSSYNTSHLSVQWTVKIVLMLNPLGTSYGERDVGSVDCKNSPHAEQDGIRSIISVSVQWTVKIVLMLNSINRRGTIFGFSGL